MTGRSYSIALVTRFAIGGGERLPKAGYEIEIVAPKPIHMLRPVRGSLAMIQS